jgi:hypothetical protein
MIRLRQSVLRHRHLAMLALVLAFALRALIPQGMMTAPDAARGITVLLCDGSGTAARLAVPLGEKPAKAPSDQTCPFAVLAQTGTADAPVDWTIAPSTAPRLPQQYGPESPEPSQTRQTHPPARAPPVAA